MTPTLTQYAQWGHKRHYGTDPSLAIATSGKTTYSSPDDSHITPWAPRQRFTGGSWNMHIVKQHLTYVWRKSRDVVATFQHAPKYTYSKRLFFQMERHIENLSIRVLYLQSSADCLAWWLWVHTTTMTFIVLVVCTQSHKSRLPDSTCDSGYIRPLL